MELTPGGLSTEMTVNKALSLLEQVEITDQVVRQRVVIATELVEDVARLESQMKASKKRNHVLHTAAVTQLRYPSEGRDCYHKKLTEAKTTKEAIRALKRRISDVVYRRLLADAQRRNSCPRTILHAPNTPETALDTERHR